MATLNSTVNKPGETSCCLMAISEKHFTAAKSIGPSPQNRAHGPATGLRQAFKALFSQGDEGERRGCRSSPVSPALSRENVSTRQEVDRRGIGSRLLFD